MILEFSITNFLSFKERVTFSMLANNSTGLDNNYIIKNDKKILKTAAIYGANASGKSNIFKVLTSVVLMLRNSNNMDINDKLPIIPFKLDKKSNMTASEFEIKFIINNVRYVYGFMADENIIYDEYLYYYPNGRETKIFDKTYGDRYSFPQKDERFLKDIASKNTPNKFFLATATNWNYEKTKLPYEFLTKNINTFGNINDLRPISLKKYLENNNDLKTFALDILKKADFNIIDYNVFATEIPIELIKTVADFIKVKNNLKAFNVTFKHQNGIGSLSLDEESLGTQIIFILIPFIMDAMNKSEVIVIDELDRSLHPYLVELIVEMFNDPEINKNGAQLIFNTHDTNLLNLNILRRDQIWFTEKNNKNGISDLYTLSDFSVRKNENVEKGYLLGRYGAIPFIKNDLNLWEKD